MIKPVARLIQALSSNSDPGAIAHAFACGILLGFMPKNNLLWYVLFVFILFLRIQRATYSISVIIGALFAPLLDPIFDAVGVWILTRESLVPFFAGLLDIPFVSFTRFNNSIVMGSLCCSLIVYFPLYALSRLWTHLWRTYIASRVRKLKVVQIMEKIPLVEKIRDIANEIEFMEVE